MRRLHAIGLVVAAGIGIAMFALMNQSRPRALSKASGHDAVTIQSATPTVDAQQLERLAREVDRLKNRVQHQGMEYQMARAEAVPSSAPKEEAPIRSPAEERQARLSYHVRTFETQGRDDAAAQGFESTVHEGFASIEHSALENVECRSTMCRVEIVHFDQNARDKFSDFVLGSGPLKYGTFDYSTEDGKRTIAYVGMPGHRLERPPEEALRP